MVKNALLGWVGSLVTIYNTVAKKNQLRVSNDLLELSCLYNNLRSVTGSSGLLETWGMLCAICNDWWGGSRACGGQGLWYIPAMLKTALRRDEPSHHPRAVLNALPDTDVGQTCYYLSPEPYSILYVNPKHGFIVFTELFRKTTSASNKDRSTLVQNFTKRCFHCLKISNHWEWYVSPTITPLSVCICNFSIHSSST